MLDEIMSRVHALWLSIRLTYHLFLDSRVPMWTKAVPILTVLYIFSPIDVIPDFLLVLGQLDDLVVLSAGLSFFEKLAPPDVVEEHRYRLLQESGQEQEQSQQYQ